MAKSGSIKIPTRESEAKREKEEDAARQRLEENGRCILTMWKLGFMIQENHRYFQLTSECKNIIDTFRNFTNLTGIGIDLTEDDIQILRDFKEFFMREYTQNNMNVHEGVTCRELWKRSLETHWTSEGFLHFEAKFAPNIVLFSKKKADGASLTLSDNQNFLDNLTKFLRELSIFPTTIQRVTSFYASSGLTAKESEDLLWTKKKVDHTNHQLKIASAKLKAANDTLKDAKDREDFLQMFLEKANEKMHKLAEQNESLKKEVEASRIAIAKFGNPSLPECIVCNALYCGGPSMMIVDCCGQLLCRGCYDQIKKINYAHHGDTPPCPNCRAQVEKLVPIIDDHPTIRKVTRKKMVDAETTFDPDVFLEAQIGGPEIEPISKPSRPPSIYVKLMESQLSDGQARASASGGGAARPNPHGRRGEPPGARAYA